MEGSEWKQRPNYSLSPASWGRLCPAGAEQSSTEVAGLGGKTECVIDCLIITGKGSERMEWHRDLSFTNSSEEGRHLFQRTELISEARSHV